MRFVSEQSKFTSFTGYMTATASGALLAANFCMLRVHACSTYYSSTTLLLVVGVRASYAHKCLNSSTVRIFIYF